MKRILLVIMIVFCAVGVNAQFSKASLQATGLTCAMCSNAINKALQKLPFVESVKADIKNSAFAIVFKPGAAVDFDALHNAVEGAGFSIGHLNVTGKFEHLSIANDEHVKIGNELFHFVNVKSAILDGEQTLTLIDKEFLTAKEFKKKSAATKMACIRDGRTADCCAKNGMAAGQRIYHVTI
jgi:copper chaperone CopZ